MPFDLTYDTLASFAQTAGLVYFVVIFLAVVAYAYWPSNKERLEEAANIPLKDEDPS